MQEVIIHSFEQLQQEVFQGVWDGKVRRYRANRVYRGVADKEWGFLPSLNRVCKHDISLEKHILRSFKKYGFTDLQQIPSFWQMLAMAQQHGLPTRLLDWTYSPYVAAHFVTEDIEKYDKDGALWCASIEEINQNLPCPLRKMLEDEGGSIFSVDMLDSVGNGFESLADLCAAPFSLFFEPASTVDRIANQYALFSLTSDPNILINEMPSVEDSLKKIIIPHEVKLEIRDKLDYINISERMIFPGLDGICKWITRRYADLGKYNPEKR